MKIFKNISPLFLTVIFLLSSCVKDLDREPFYDVTSANVYKDFANYKLILAKLYAGYAVSGQQGPAGKPDLTGIDEGFSNYLRQYWQLQELPTDDAVIGWNDGTIGQLNTTNWTPANEFITVMYNRIFYQITLCNEFIRETTDEKLSERGITGANADEARTFRTEARFLRALSYSHALDLFGNVPFVTEEDAVGSFFPKQTTRAELFDYIESELKDLETAITPAGQNEYARADAAAVWTLLAKLYLNAEVYNGQARYADVITYCNKVIGAGFTLEPEYRNLFLADNHNSNEIIFPIAFDGLHTKSYGGITYLVHAPVGGSMNPEEYGVAGGWAGLRATKGLVNLFPDATGTIDKRGMFHTDGQELEINSISTFTDGYPVTKWKNVTSTGEIGSDPVDFPDTDYPMFRLADVYLMYAEAVLRNGGGDAGTALGYVNALRTRAYGNEDGNLTADQLTLDFILDERGRELHWEAVRRTDLIRFGKFTSGNYVWPWKGGVMEGKEIDDYRALYPLPSADLIANPGLDQNDGY